MKKIDSIQGLRAVAFILVFLGHCGIGQFADFAVTVFFCLSGFLMIYNYYYKDISCGILKNLRFSISKIKKLYPLYIITMFPMAALFIYSVKKANTFSDSLIIFILQVLSNIVLMQAWIPIRDYYFALNGVAWFLSVMLFLYYIFPFILKLFKRIEREVQIYVIIGGVVLFRVFLSLLAGLKILSNNEINLSWLTYIFPIYRLGDFLSGCCVGWIFLKRKNKKTSVLKGTIFEICTVLIIICWRLLVQFTNLPDGVVSSSLRLICPLFIIYVIGCNSGYFSYLLSQKPFVVLGNISGYTYLIHQVLLNITESFRFPILISGIVSFIGSVLFAVVYITIFNKLKNIGKERATC